jgi:hypothetical protein
LFTPAGYAGFQEELYSEGATLTDRVPEVFGVERLDELPINPLLQEKDEKGEYLLVRNFDKESDLQSAFDLVIEKVDVLRNTSQTRTLSFTVMDVSQDMSALKPDISRTIVPISESASKENRNRISDIGNVLAVTVVELKRSSKKNDLSSDECLGQLHTYLIAILRLQPLRTFAIGALFNGQSLIVSCVKRLESSQQGPLLLSRNRPFSVKFMRLSDPDEVLRGLSFVLFGDASHLGWVDLEFEKQTLHPCKLLGRGATSFVYQAVPPSGAAQFALKIAHSPATALTLSREDSIVNELRMKLDQSDRSLLPSVGTVTGPLTGMIILVLSPVGVPFSVMRSEHLAMIPQILRLLDSIHKLGYVHMDPRVQNILVHGPNPLLIDFGFAKKLGDRVFWSKLNDGGAFHYLEPSMIDALKDDAIG